MLVCFLLAWCVELVLCALHAGRTWGVAGEGGEEKQEKDAGRKEVEGMGRNCQRGQLVPYTTRAKAQLRPWSQLPWGAGCLPRCYMLRVELCP